MNTIEYPAEAYRAWADFHRAAQEVGPFVMAARHPALVTDDGLVAVNLGRVAMIFGSADLETAA